MEITEKERALMVEVSKNVLTWTKPEPSDLMLVEQLAKTWIYLKRAEKQIEDKGDMIQEPIVEYFKNGQLKKESWIVVGNPAVSARNTYVNQFQRLLKDLGETRDKRLKREKGKSEDEDFASLLAKEQ